METQQQEIFESEVKPFLEYPFLGENVTIFAYGNTGAGSFFLSFSSFFFDTSLFTIKIKIKIKIK